jgi:hypothetical protein
VPAFKLYQRPNAQLPALLDDLLGFAANGHQRAIDTAIAMLQDLHRAERPSECTFARKLQGLPIWELKPHARGGIVGGLRIYFYLQSDSRLVLINAELKEGTSPGFALREAVLVTAAALRNP